MGIKRFIEILQVNRVRTLLDARFNPYSRNPDFRKNKLTQHLNDNGLKYVHLKDYGIPSEIRKAGEPLEWYAKNVVPKIQPSIIEQFEQPVCFMCMENDLNHCHRKVILETLNGRGLKGRDLTGYPTIKDFD